LPNEITTSAIDGPPSVEPTIARALRSSRPAVESSAYLPARTPKTSSAPTETAAAGVRRAGGRITRSGCGAVAVTPSKLPLVAVVRGGRRMRAGRGWRSVDGDRDQ